MDTLSEEQSNINNNNSLEIKREVKEIFDEDLLNVFENLKNEEFEETEIKIEREENNEDLNNPDTYQIKNTIPQFCSGSNQSSSINIETGETKTIILKDDPLDLNSSDREEQSLKENCNFCEICKKHFRSRQNLRRHERIHTGEKLFKCELCHKCFTEKKTLEGHIRTHTGEKPFTCDICNQKFNLKSNLKKHTLKHTGEKKDESVQCNICKKIFCRRQVLERHIMSTHEAGKNFSCEFCPKYFDTKEKHSKHIESHSKEKRFQCEFCSKKFNLRHRLFTHLRTHTGEKPFPCNMCDKRFNTRYNFTQHCKRIHKSDNKLYCEICNRSFFEHKELVQHTRTHFFEKPFECDQCNVKCKTKGAWVKHKKLHDTRKKQVKSIRPILPKLEVQIAPKEEIQTENEVNIDPLSL